MLRSWSWNQVRLQLHLLLNAAIGKDVYNKLMGVGDYRKLVKGTWQTVSSSAFRNYLLRCYRLNANSTQAQPIIQDWLSLLNRIVKEQTDAQKRRANKEREMTKREVSGMEGNIAGREKEKMMSTPYSLLNYEGFVLTG
jgi:hypothetical protein